MKKIIGTICLILVVSFSSFAQIDKEKAIKPRHELKIADLLYAQSHYYSAAEYYKEVVRSKPENRYAKYWLAMATLKAADYPNALKFFRSFDEHRLDPKIKAKRLAKENNEIYGLANYYYGVSLKHNADFEGAIEKFKEFKAKYDMPDKADWNKIANNEINGAEWAIAHPDSRKVKIKTLGDLINTGYEDAAPMPINDSTIYYTSLQEDDLVFIQREKDIPLYRLYQSTKVDGVWQRGKKLQTVFQDEKFGTGNSAISEDGNRMYFCKCFHNEIDEIICNLYLSEKKKDRWQEAVALNSSINDPKYTSTQPAVRTSGDGMDIIYFVSDREGGKGGMDIWYFIRTARGDFKGPRLLGGAINTSQDEMTPYYDNTQNLFYFSSNGHPSMGGLDVFVSYEDDDLGWIEPENLGLPVNSTADDLYYVKEPGKTSGFLVSNREGTTKIRNKYVGDDIFYFEDFKYGLEGFVFKEEENGEVPLEGATVRLYTTDAHGNEIMVEELVNIKETYFFNLKPDKEYKVEVVKTGYSSSFEYLSTTDIPYEDTLNRNLRVNKTFTNLVGNLYDDKDTLMTSKLDNAILTLYEVNPDGSKLSLTTKRMAFGVADFFFSLDNNKVYQIDVVKDGYFKKSIPVKTNNKDQIEVVGLLTAIEVGKSYELANILYDFGKATLREESKVVLDELIEILRENPSIVIELGSHTDSKGTDELNFKLSQARAQSCVDHIISKGISKSRLVAKGYGESSPIAPNENEDGSDNEEGRQKNRRTEFKVLETF
jgi:outer membrane protein OmpA-like peptidoglycan-associated protein/tetratricopeptide (TPR) repeat protein